MNYETMAKLMSTSHVFIYKDMLETKVKEWASFMSSYLVVNPSVDDLCNDCFVTPGSELPSFEHIESRLYIPESMSDKIKCATIHLN